MPGGRAFMTDAMIKLGFVTDYDDSVGEQLRAVALTTSVVIFARRGN